MFPMQASVMYSYIAPHSAPALQLPPDWLFTADLRAACALLYIHLNKLNMPECKLFKGYEAKTAKGTCIQCINVACYD